MRYDKIMELEIVVFDFEGTNALGQLRTYGKMGYKPSLVLICADSTPHYIHKCKYIEHIYVKPTIEEGLSFLLREYSKCTIPVVVSSGSDIVISALDKIYDTISSHFIFYNAGEQGRLSSFMEKEALRELAIRSGLNAPSAKVVKVGSLPQDLSYPVITKAANSNMHNWKSVSYICKSENELLKAYKKIGTSEIIVQEYVEKKNEYILQGVSYNNGKQVFIPLEGYYYRIIPGRYACYLYFQKYSGRKYGEVCDMIRKIGYNGIFEIEFLVDKNDELQFLEINFRQTAWNHTFYKMGVCLEQIWIDSQCKSDYCVPEYEIRHRFNLMDGLADFQLSVKDSKMSILHWIKDLIKTDGFMILDFADPRPFLAQIFFLIKRKLIK